MCGGSKDPSTGFCTRQPTAERRPRGSRAQMSRKLQIERALRVMRRALEKSPLEQRRASLQGLSHRAQVSLLRFMERGEASCGSKAADSRELTKGSYSKETSSKIASTALQALKEQRSAGKQRVRGPNTPVPGITRAGIGRYRTQAFILGIRMLTVAAPSLEVVETFQEILAKTKQAVLSCGATLCAARIEEALSAACSLCGLEVSALGLAFRAEVRVPGLLKHDIWGRYTMDLERALEERQLILDCQAQGWPTLRQAWIQILQQPVLVRCGAPKGWARHAQLTAEQAQQMVDKAWAQSASVRELKRRRAEVQRRLQEAKEQRAAQRAARVPAQSCKVQRAARALSKASSRLEALLKREEAAANRAATSCRKATQCHQLPPKKRQRGSLQLPQLQESRILGSQREGGA